MSDRMEQVPDGDHVRELLQVLTHIFEWRAVSRPLSGSPRRDPPAITNSITRTLKSPGYGPRIGQPSSESMR